MSNIYTYWKRDNNDDDQDNYEKKERHTEIQQKCRQAAGRFVGEVQEDVLHFSLKKWLLSPMIIGQREKKHKNKLKFLFMYAYSCI